MKAKKIPGVPEQKKGGFHDTESQKEFSAEIDAKFEKAKERLFLVNHWKEYCGDQSADFQLYDEDGVHLVRNPKVGDFIRIDIPGPGEAKADGYDWVQITSIFIDENEAIIICNPSVMPGENRNCRIAHFYSSQATSTFRIVKKNNEILAGIYGRNESPNFNASFIDKVRNILIAIGGMLGFSKIQWKCLADGLLDV